MYKNRITNTILKSEKLEAFPPRSGKRQGYRFSPLIFEIVPEVLSNAIRQQQQKRSKRHIV